MKKIICNAQTGEITELPMTEGEIAEIEHINENPIQETSLEERFAEQEQVINDLVALLADKGVIW